MFIIQREIFIKASAETVYEAVSQLDCYQYWNPWVIHCTNGDAAVGEYSLVQVKLGKKLMKVKHRIVERTPYKRFVWCDTGWFTLFAFGQRARNIHSCEQGVNYQIELKITGLLAFVAKFLYSKILEQGIAAETDALKCYCEAK